MATEAAIRKVLDLITGPPPAPRVPSAHIEAVTARTAAVHQVHTVLRDRNVIGVGISEKISRRQKTGELALTFYVRKKESLDRIRADRAVPPTMHAALSGATAIPTDVVELGELTLDKLPYATREPIEPGNSIGHPTCLAGTLGAIVKRGAVLYVLSNCHVLANNGRARRGDPILYPARADKGKAPADVIATFLKAVRLRAGGAYVNRADCAIARLTPHGRRVLPAIRLVGGPSGTVLPKRGMRIVKVGRTTRKTVGVIKDIHFRFSLQYDGVGEVGFRDQVLCTRYSAAGDSGALVLHGATGRAVGLHFASAENGSVFSPIGPVLKQLGVQLVTAARRKKR